MAQAPDVLLIAAEWRSRVLLRAELLERGVDTLAVDTWPTARHVLLSRVTPPGLVLLDLQGLPEPDRLLNELAALVPSDRVMVLTAPSAVSAAAIERRGFTQVVGRPFSIGQIAARVQELLSGPSG